MKNSNNLFVIVCFFQWISCCYHYENGPLYRQFHGPFVNQQRTFYQPHLQEEIKSKPLINFDLKPNYTSQPIDFKTVFQDHTHSKINYSFETTPIKAPAYLYAMIAADHAKNKTDQSHDFSSHTVLKDPCLQKVPLKKADLQLAHEWRQSLHVYEQYGSDSADRFLNRIQAISDRTLSNKTVAIEQLLLQETHDLTNIIETTTNPLIQKQSDSLRQCIKAAQEFVALKEIKTASTILDFCWSFVELATAVGQGFCNAIINVQNHPQEVAIVITGSMFAPQILCAYHAYQMMRHCYPIAKDLANIAMTALHDPTQGLDDFKAYINPLTAFIDSINNKEFQLNHLIKSGIMIAAQWYAEQKLYAGLSTLYGSLKDTAVAWVCNNPSLSFNHYLKTPDGILLKAASGNLLPSQERITQTLNRTEDFFTITEFGKKHAKDFVRTIYGHRPNRAFQAIITINDQIKKGYYIVLDGLHKNHLEVYGSNKKWLKVINFDGTLNEHLTVKALQSDPRKPLSIIK